MLDGNSDASGGEWINQDPFAPEQIAGLSSTIRAADKAANVSFQTFIGRLTEGRATALEVHSKMPNSPDTVLIAVDPHSRGLEIVVGPVAKESIDDRTCQLAALTMTSRFVVGDLINGLRDGIGVMADHSHPRYIPHSDLPENA